MSTSINYPLVEEAHNFFLLDAPNHTGVYSSDCDHGDVFGLEQPTSSMGADAATIPIEDVFQIGEPAPAVDLTDGVPPAKATELTMSNATYQAMDNVLSCSMIKKLLRSPAHMKAESLKEKKELASQRIGTGFHAAVLEFDRFQSEYIVFDGTRRGQRWTDFSAANANKQILTQVEYDAIVGMRNAVLNYKELPLRSAIDLGVAEKSIVWIDPETGVRCRIRPDLHLQVGSRLLLDLKSIDDCRPDSFIHQIFRMDYDLQAAMYIEGVFHLTGERVPFYLVACEIDTPHGVWVYEILPDESDPIYRNGMNKFRNGLRLYKECAEAANWPGYTNPYTGSGSLRVPSYYLAPLAGLELPAVAAV